MRALLTVGLVILSATPARADEPSPGRVAGVVVGRDGRPIAGVTLILTGSEDTIQSNSSASGRFEIPDVPPGSYTLLSIFGEATATNAPITVAPGASVEVRPTLGGGPEVITIREAPPPVNVAEPIPSSQSRNLPWSDEAREHNVWAVGWALLDIDAAGKVASFRYLHRPGHDLEKIAEQEIWRLRFKPAVDAAGVAVPSQRLWKLEWPAFWWWQEKQMSPTAGFHISVYDLRRNYETARPQHPRPGRNGSFTGSDLPRLPGCRGKGPLNLENREKVYRDCSRPSLAEAREEKLISRDGTVDQRTLDARACDAQIAGACVDAGMALELQGALAAAAGLYDRGCAGGDGGGCLNLALLHREGRGVSRDVARAHDLAGRACAGELGAGCLLAAELGIDDTAAAAVLLRRGCDLGEARACELAAAAMTGGDALAAALARNVCDQGDPRACHNLGVAIEVAEAARAAVLYDKACSGGVASACSNLGRLYERGAGVAADRDRATALYERACAGGAVVGCLNHGVMATSRRDYARAAADFRRACDAGDDDACQRLERVRGH